MEVYVVAVWTFDLVCAYAQVLGERPCAFLLQFEAFVLGWHTPSSAPLYACGIIFGVEYCLAVFLVVFVYLFVAAQGSEFVVGGCKFIFGLSFTPSEIIAFVYGTYRAYCPVRPHQAAGQTEVYILMSVLKFFFRRLRGCAKCANR